MRIYVSSTLTDLYEHREAVKRVIESLKDMNFEYVGIEYLDTSIQPPLDVCLRAVGDSQLLILLIGWRYGYVPEGYEKSLMELEYDIAVKNKISVLTYMMDDRHPVSPKFIDTGEGAERLRHFRGRLKREKVVRTFGSPEDLAQKVSIDLSYYYTKLVSEIAEDIIDKPQLKRELESYKEESAIYVSTIDALRQRLENIVPAEPIWNTRNFKIDTTFCFVLMPFQERFFCVYEEAILPALNSAGLRGIHAGEIFDNREIIEDIWESICTARLIIADVTGRNPNVFYELGVCHTLGKEVIVLTQNCNDVPFDIRHRRFLEYDETKLHTLKTKLEKTVKNVILRS
ncbi:MAG: hypothetical protein QOD00_3366 [Blastocatellia bacterium]|nr:hypothetical protein [Blastocatellia bacterium]